MQSLYKRGTCVCGAKNSEPTVPQLAGLTVISKDAEIETIKAQLNSNIKSVQE